MSQLTKQQAKEVAWRRGLLDFKLDANQREFIEAFRSGSDKISTVLFARRSGKTYMLSVLAISECLKKPNYQVRFVCPTKTMAQTISRDVIRQIVEDCPEDIKPEYIVREYTWRFKNGSIIQLGGTDNKAADRLRGTSMDLGIVDEAGFCADLRYVVNSILMPQALTTGGRLLLSSTPPKSPGHEFFHYIKDARQKDKLIIKTVYDNPRIKLEDLDAIIEECGGVDSPDFKREYLCDLNVSADSSIVPEWTPELEQELVVNWTKPNFCDFYVGADIGMTDWTVALFAYYDFKADKIVFVDELVLKSGQMNTRLFAAGVDEKEATHFYSVVEGTRVAPVKRVSDVNPILINDLRRFHGLDFEATQKDTLVAMINNFRVLIANKRIVIDPRCKVLVNHIKNAEWTKAEKLSYLSDGSHADALMAAIYLVRAINFRRNPFPTHHEFNPNSFYSQGYNAYENKNNTNKQVASKMFPSLFKKS